MIQFSFLLSHIRVKLPFQLPLKIYARSKNIPYIFESNSHLNLIRTSFCWFLKRKKVSVDKKNQLDVTFGILYFSS